MQHHLLNIALRQGVVRLEGEQIACARHLDTGQSHAPHSHPGQDKLYVVLEGSGEVQIGAETRTLSPGGTAFAPDGVEHAIHNPGPARLVVMAILGPPPSRK